MYILVSLALRSVHDKSHITRRGEPRAAVPTARLCREIVSVITVVVVVVVITEAKVHVEASTAEASATTQLREKGLPLSRQSGLHAAGVQDKRRAAAAPAR